MPNRTARDEVDFKADNAVDSTAEEECRTNTDYRIELDQFFSIAYEELRHLAASVRYSAAPNSPLSPSTLVNEAWLRLAHASNLAPDSKLHFKRIAARAMRRVLVEAARRQFAKKRGAGEAHSVAFEDSLLVSADQDLITLDDALTDLALINP